jgi:hypothetical protein
MPRSTGKGGYDFIDKYLKTAALAVKDAVKRLTKVWNTVFNLVEHLPVISLDESDDGESSDDEDEDEDGDEAQEEAEEEEDDEADEDNDNDDNNDGDGDAHIHETRSPRFSTSHIDDAENYSNIASRNIVDNSTYAVSEEPLVQQQTRDERNENEHEEEQEQVKHHPEQEGEEGEEEEEEEEGEEEEKENELEEEDGNEEDGKERDKPKQQAKLAPDAPKRRRSQGPATTSVRAAKRRKKASQQPSQRTRHGQELDALLHLPVLQNFVKTNMLTVATTHAGGGASAMVKCAAAFRSYKSYVAQNGADKSYRPIGQIHQFTAAMDQVEGMQGRRQLCSKKGFQCDVYMGMTLRAL